MSEQLLASSAADSSDLPETYGAEAMPAAPSVGQQLRAARETKDMSVADVAKALKLSTNQVMALEGDDWSRLPGTIIRGFIRNYARLLNLDTESLMHELTGSQVLPPPTLTPDLPAGSKTTLPEAGQAGRRDYAVVFSGLALVLIALLAYFFLPQDFWQSTLTALTPGGKPSVAMPEKSEPMPASIPQPLSQPEGAPAGAVAPEPASPPKQLPQAGPSQSNSAPGEGLKLSFAQPSWVEIRDRSGEVIFSQLNPAGSQRDIEGQPPFALVIGNAANVTVQYKGRVVDLSQRSKDDVARLNLD